MNLLSLPWLEFALSVPVFGAAIVRWCDTPRAAWRVASACTSAALIGTLAAWAAQANEVARAHTDRLFSVDTLSAPLLPLVAGLHVLTILTTAAVKMNRMSFTGHLLGESIRLATFACIDPWPLIALLILGSVVPYIEMRGREKPTRLYLLHMLLFGALLVIGRLGMEAEATWGVVCVLLAVLVRSGTFPAHLWVPDLFENATLGTALLFVTPIAGVYAALRLVLPNAPDWVLESIGSASLLTAIYAAGMALVQIDVRRFFAYFFLSHASLILIGLELHTTTSLIGALCLWASVALSLGGLGLVLRALEGRYGRLSLQEHHGLYERSPALAVGFLLMGLASVGFPGTVGFVSAELLIDGAIEANLYVGLGMVFAAALNGIVVVRVYLLLFTGRKSTSSLDLRVTPRERSAVLILVILIFGGGLIPQVMIQDRRQAAVELLRAPGR